MKKTFFTLCCLIELTILLKPAEIMSYKAEKGVVMKTLPTGQKLIIAEDKSLPVTHVYAVLKSGSIWDPPEIEGITSLMGEILMRGTQTRTREELRNALDQLGAEIDIDVGHEHMTIVGQTLTRNLDPFLAIFSDVILHPRFYPKEIEKLKREAISDLKHMRENDQALVGRFFVRQLFKAHPYAMSADGKESTIVRITDKKIQEFYKKHFYSENIFFAAAGDLDASSLSKKLADHFKSVPKGNALSFSYPKPPKLEGKHILLVDKPARTQTQIMIGHMGIDVLNPDFFPLIIANNAFGGGFTARLMHEVRVKRGWSYGAYSWFRPKKEPGEFGMMAFPATKDTIDTVSLMLSLYEEYAKSGLTQEEFERSKSNLINEFAFKIDTARRKVGQILMIELMGLPKDYLETYRDKLKAVTLGEVNQAIQKYSDPKNLIITIVCTAKDIQPKLKSLGSDFKVTVKNFKED